MAAVIPPPTMHHISDASLVEHTTNGFGNHLKGKGDIIMLPDMHISIMSPEPRINPTYQAVRQEADEFARR